MNPSPDERRALQSASELEGPLAAVEGQLHALGEALQQQDAAAVERAAAELHQALARAVDHFARAARTGSVPPLLRRRLAHAGGQVAAQRESLARATASLDRAIDVLMPRPPSAPFGGFYSASGGTDRPASQGALLA
jgi:multidrug resistance efflux pump